MISVNFKGRFGNHLFQLSCANFLSKKFDQPVANKWDRILVQNETGDKFFNKTMVVNNDSIERVFNQESNQQNIVLDDYFQTRYCISKFLEYNTYQNNSEQLGNYTFVHIRLGDINNIMSLDYEYYDEAIGLFGNEKVLISSDSPNDEMVLRLKDKYDATIFRGNEVEAILMGANCKNRVLSLGTFSWWIGFLGNNFWGDKINTVCPRVDRTIKWHGDIFPLFDWRSV